MYTHLQGRMAKCVRKAQRKAWGGVSRKGIITSCRRIQVQEGFVEEVVFDVSLEGWMRIC